MKIFIDESGGFNWTNPGISIFCGVTIPDRDLNTVLGRFDHWRRSVIGHSTRELKGCELTEAQITSFVNKVLPGSDRDVWLTVQGVDTKRTKKHIIEQLTAQDAEIFERSSEIMQEHKNLRMKEQYRQMSGWVRSRSVENVYWIIALQETVINSLQHTIIRFMEPEDDSEFNDFRIFIDQSFIRRDEHISFWREWLRADLAKSSRKNPTNIPDTWRKRSHPFIHAYSIYPGLLDLNRLFVKNTGFFRSEKIQGLQIADICAHTLYRYYRGNGVSEAYRRMRPRIVGRGGAEINMLLVNENSLHKDDPKNHAGIFDIEEYKRRADVIRSQNSKSNLLDME
jgi:hypothetical protein